MFTEPFNINGEKLFRIHIFRAAKKETIVLLNAHHIVFDGGSAFFIVNTLLSSYKSLLAGVVPNLRSQNKTYFDFVAVEKALIASEEGESRLSFWRRMLVEPLPNLDSMADFCNLSELQSIGNTYQYEISGGMFEKIKKFSRVYSSYLSSVFLTVFKLLINQYSGHKDIIVGMPFEERGYLGFQGHVGLFMNIVPVRSLLNADETLLQHLKTIQKNIIDSIAKSYPFSTLIRKLNIAVNLPKSPLVQVGFFYQNFSGSSELEGLKNNNQDLFSFELLEDITQEGAYGLTLEIFERESGFLVNFKYDSLQYKDSTIHTLMDEYIALFNKVLRNPEKLISEYSESVAENGIFPLDEWNKTNKSYPREKCFYELFVAQAQKSPESVAVQCQDRLMTYGELDHRSTVLAKYLQTIGVKPGTIVAICVNRTLDIHVGLLAIQKAGGTFIALDPSYPEDRLAYMLNDGSAKIVLVQEDTENCVNSVLDKVVKDNCLPPIVLSFNREWVKIESAADGVELRKQADAEQMIYVIYTSGSTGRPKGVMISNRSFVNLLFAMKDILEIGDRDCFIAVSTYCFDMSGLELFLPLLVGGKCCVLSEDEQKNTNQLLSAIKKYKPTMMQATPVTWKSLFDLGWSNEESIKILCGGEALPENLKQEFIRAKSDSWNMYGPTETTIWSTYQKITDDNRICIGKPIANTKIYIVNSDGKLAAVGDTGELWIGGDGVGKGYLNNPELTLEKFIANPFCDDRKSRIYKTGDQARWLSDGSIEYLGRFDQQVKLRGFRIELGEIENRLNAFPLVKQSVVVLQSEPVARLIAYYIPSQKIRDERIISRQMRDFLGAVLPSQMIPSFFVATDSFPLTATRKVNRKELEKRPIEMDQATQESRPESMHNLVDGILGLWSETLHVKGISENDNFFEAGGNSVLAVSIADKIQKLTGVEFSPVLLFKYNTVNNIAKYILGQRTNVESRIEAEIPVESVSAVKKPLGNSDTCPEYYKECVAIIGISCHFPGASNYEKFWQNIRSGVESIQIVSNGDLEKYSLPDAICKNEKFVAVQSSIEGKNIFDPGFFSISPGNAMLMDPQLRLLLTHSWRAFEDAGYVPENVPNTSVFMSSGVHGYNSNVKATSIAPEVTQNSTEYVSWILSQGGSIPTMISYQLGLQGQSVFVHTNCSSSLSAIHSACQSLLAGDAEYSLVGAASLFPVDSVGYIFQPGLNFSSNGHIKTFDENADGMVGGEGVGVVLLKRAEDAIRDNDQIYALIRGVGMNNDGSNKAGFYAPSVRGQSSVIEKVLLKTGVHPGTIGYVEAHGTGTALGDPIELMALTEAYRTYTQEKQYCAIGSLKPNIGHLDAAAGLAGCIKAALCLFNREIPPSINYERPNPAIDFNTSPFYVNTQLKPWPSTNHPRRAALSSFGVGGTNTHAILEESSNRSIVEENNCIPGNADSFLVALSAEKKENLTAYANSYVEFLAGWAGLSLSEDRSRMSSMTYTLLVGRRAMKSRVAFLVKSSEELILELVKFLRGEASARCFYGELLHKHHDSNYIDEDDDFKELVSKWIKSGKVEKLAKWWVQGRTIPWKELFVDKTPKKISLPTYPFSKIEIVRDEERKIGIVEPASRISRVKELSPLLHENTSDLLQQSYTSRFNGSEFFLADHQIKGQKVLPGVGYLEMARVAVEKAIGKVEENVAIQLKNIVWLQPIVVGNDGCTIHVGLSGAVDDEIFYEIYTEEGSNVTVNSEGVAELVNRQEDVQLNVKDILASMTKGVLTGEDCYSLFARMGMEYGPGHRGLREIHRGESQVLGMISLPPAIAETRGDYVLHPCLMDAALQSTTGLMFSEVMAANHIAELGSVDPALFKPGIPFALSRLDILKGCSSTMYSWVRYAEGSGPSDRVQKLDIDLMDEEGNVCVRFHGFSARTVEGELGSRTGTGLLQAQPVWKETRLETAVEPRDLYKEHLIIVCDDEGALCRGDVRAYQQQLEARLPDSRCLILEAGTEQTRKRGLADRFTEQAVNCFELLKTRLQQKPQGKVLCQILVANRGEAGVFGGLSGLLKTAALENPKIVGQIIGVDPGESVDKVAGRLIENRSAPDAEIRYRNDRRWTKGWEEIAVPTEVPATTFTDGGVYLITGGVGGLGLIFAREILRTTQGASIILTGRSVLAGERRARFERLQEESMPVQGVVDYQAVDVSDPEQVERLVSAIQHRFGKLNGILHSAGVIQDNFILKKTTAEFCEVLAPKVSGSVCLDEASKMMKLDFFVLFSSGAGALGNVGQSDYSTANAFMDLFADYRNELVSKGQRQGRTRAINWPLWKEGGMSVDASSEKMMEQMFGIAAMETSVGIAAFHRCISGEHVQRLVVAGKLLKIRNALLSKTREEKEPENSLDQDVKSPGNRRAVVNKAEELNSVDRAGLIEKVGTFLIGRVSDSLKIKREDIDLDTKLDEYGFDSILLTEFANKLNEQLRVELTPAVFFEYSTLGEFSKYLASDHEDKLLEYFQVKTESGSQKATVEISPLAVKPSAKPRRRPLSTQESDTPVAHNEGIAIIGMSGSFPMARDVNEFWQNLVNERDCISEIPLDRWDWEAFYGDPSENENKTNVKWGGFIDGIDEFDPLFFGVSIREARLMDPHHRLLMTHTWKAIEDSGYSARSFSGSRTAIFVGISSSGYTDLIAKAGIPIDGYSATGAVASVGPNRISYLLNIHGPSEPIETACSSSLVAVHRGVQSIERGDCEMAIVGGINSMLTPSGHIAFGKAGMLSGDGRCKPFSSSANGYVRAEGVGILLLKNLVQAEKENDHIYAVIKGSAVNHGGRAQSLTAPNGRAQASLIVDAYRKAGIDPRSVTYIEAHGTGTRLGDPVEINGLKSAFDELSGSMENTLNRDDEGTKCGVGSVKSNIGHLEIAAGVAGIIKVIMQLRHRTLVKSLHCDEINKYISLENSPFYLVSESTDWVAVRDLDGKVLPRRAGISSFGFGGVNAHVVMEEYVQSAECKSDIRVEAPNHRYMVILSAKKKERLLESARRLLDFLDKNVQPLVTIESIAFTLQVGRDPLDERLGIVADSVEQLQGTLKAFINGDGGIQHCYSGNVKEGKKILSGFALDDELSSVVEQWILRGKNEKVLDFWVKGLDIDWHKLYETGVLNRKNRVSLPTYPFERVRCWVDQKSEENIALNGDSHRGAATKNINAISLPHIPHPFFHVNTSTQEQLKFVAKLDKSKFYFSDHMVNGSCILSGAAQIEMALAGCVRLLDFDKNSISFRNISWVRPIVAEQSQPLVDVYYKHESNNDEVQYRIQKVESSIDGSAELYSQGMVTPLSAIRPEAINLEAEKARCFRAVNVKSCYEALAEFGLYYGAGHQSMSEMYVGNRRVLVKLRIPESISNTFEDYHIHPSLFDGALQSVIGLFDYGVEQKNDAGLSLPYAIEYLHVYGSCSRTMWAVLELCEQWDGQANVNRMNVKLVNEEGEVIIEVIGFLVRRLVESRPKEIEGVEFFEEKWLPVEATHRNIAGETIILVNYAFSSERFVEKLPLGFFDGFDSVIHRELKNQNMASRFVDVASHLFQHVSDICKSNIHKKVLLQVLLPGSNEEIPLVGISGLLKSAMLESPWFYGQIVVVDTLDDLPTLLHRLQLLDVKEPIRYSNNALLSKKLVPVYSQDLVQTTAYKSAGVYLITGGFGGLGKVFVKEISDQVDRASIYLIGRSELNEEQSEIIDSLNIRETEVFYKSVDVSNENEVIDLIDFILKRHGKIDGIIHGAGVRSDELLRTKTVDDFLQTLKPKVFGLRNLDKATKDISLDFFVAFSSVSSILGNVGQSDYACANSFMDNYCEYREALRGKGLRRGLSLSVNWPLWADGGMQLDKSLVARIKDATGLDVLNTDIGAKALSTMISSRLSRCVLVQGEIRKIRKLFKIEQGNYSRSGNFLQPEAAISATDGDRIKTLLQNWVVQSIAKLLMIDESEIEVDADFSEFGLDSIALTEFGNLIYSKFGIQLTAAAMFDIRSIEAFAEFLMAETSLEISRHFTQFDSNYGDVVKNDLSDVRINVNFGDTSSYLQQEILRKLNTAASGRPIFWIHGGLGGIEEYHEIARKVERPFYGIQAVGWMTDRDPLVGLPMMASKYQEAIQSVQPKGPYDLGGFSLGGVLSYEIARRLQQAGQSVRSIVMIDSPDTSCISAFEFSRKSRYLQLVNTFITSSSKSGAPIAPIHYLEPTSRCSDDEFLENLVALAIKHGLPRSRNQILQFVKQNVRVHEAYDVSSYEILPLPYPKELSCFYFRNKSVQFFGEMEPYSIVREADQVVKYADYWKQWQSNISDFRMIDVESTSHFTMLQETESKLKVSRLCEDLYNGAESCYSVTADQHAVETIEN